MKQIIFGISIFIVLFLVNSCNSQETNKKTKENSISKNNAISNNIIHVYYFHGSIRCETCVAVDENTHQYLQELFPKQMNSGKIIFQSINIDKKEMPNLIKKYEIYGQTLLFIKGNKVINKTDAAFQYVTTNPTKWHRIIKDVISDLIK